ncbi:plastocyanin [Sulfurifustis variabilis]|uniref:Plastocyanin n=1 Tax=Sulfurifustis variabilis TaxID=1675686 RepID=A0A1B4VGK1_9GAMM|nr:cupredoxin domain-containing protein [Sulfurifustis variabilis]BAU49967.1 plastocyanin [Sulfurifustis variabilis]
MTSVLVNLTGLVLIGFIVWWFWLSGPRAARVAASGPVEVLVENGVYTPPVIEVPAGRPVTLRFLRKDPSPCAEQVRFDSLGIAAELPVGKPRDLTVLPGQPGEYEFTCQMRMYRGRLIAR